jgi:tetratricopeptide (TPR) repeat protein
MTVTDEHSKTQARDDRAHALMQSALALIPQGSWKEAAASLEAAAELHAGAGRAYDHARCLQLAATLRRSAGQTARSRALAERAKAVAPANLPLSVSILAGQAELAQTEGRYESAVAGWTAALEKARQAGLKADGINALLRRRAAAYVALGRLERAAADFDEAARVIGVVDAELPPWVWLEQADLLRQHGSVQEARQALARIDVHCRDRVPSAWLAAELALLRARLARGEGKIDEALELARQSREAALQAVAPVSYFAASAELAEALRLRNDLPGAYGALATAWATLADLLGDETARSWVEPCLLAYQVSWGESEFQKARSTYEAQRLAAAARRAASAAN